MLSHRPSNGLFTYNFELRSLRVTTFDPATSLRLDECDYTAKLVLTLRQFRDAPRRGTSKVESGYLFILHSGTNAIERLDLRKVRQSTSHGAFPAYKIRAESGSIEFQFHCSNYNARKIQVEFRKQDEYRRALQILLSQGLSATIKKPEQITPGGRAFASTISGPPQLGLPSRSIPVRQSTVAHVPGAWPASHFTSREVRTPSIPMPPPVAHDATSSTRFGVGPGYYHSERSYSPVPGPSGYCTPSQSQSQLGEDAPPRLAWALSQQPNQPFDSTPSRDFFHLSSAQRLPPTNSRHPTTGGIQYGTPQSLISSQSRCDSSFPENGMLGQAASQYYNDGGRVNTAVRIEHDTSDLMLPPTRTLPFKSNSKKMVGDDQSKGPTPHILERTWGNETMHIGREMQGNPLRNPTTSGDPYASFKGFYKESNQGARAETMIPPETRYSVSQTIPQHKLAIDGAERGLGTPHLPTMDSYLRADTTTIQASRARDIGESPSASDTEQLSILRSLEDAVERWRTGLEGGGQGDLEEVLSTIQNTAQRLHIYLHPCNRNNHDEQGNADRLRARTGARTSQVAHQPATAATGVDPGPERRHTREYKQWKDYYLLACRLYDTKEERTDPEFIHRFLRGIPGKRALRWVQMGLLHCYPSMVRLSERRSGTTIVFTKDLRWSQVCEMVTRKLKLPFPKWEIAHRS